MVCNREGDCWRVKGRPSYEPGLNLRIMEDNWKWKTGEKYRWREPGRGLPRGRTIAIADEDPDLAVYGARNRLYVTRDGGVFWSALAVELPEIRLLELTS